MNATNNPPIPREFAVYDVVMCIILSIITCGIYSLVWQNRQFRIINAWLGREEYNFWMWLGLSLITCGIYAIYIEYKFAKSINDIQRANGFPFSENLPVLAIILSLIGGSIVVYAIEQSEINRWYSLPDSPGPAGTLTA